MPVSYMDDNSVPLSENGADSRAMNRSNIVELTPADASANAPQSFSNDPIIEANLRTNAEQQAKLVRVIKSSQESGPMNQSAAEAPMTEYDQEQ
jgi:hypothetical protein